MNYIIPAILIMIGSSPSDDFVKPVHPIKASQVRGFINPVADLAESYDIDYEWVFEGIDSPITYREIREMAINNCRNRQPDKVDVDLIDFLIEVEKDFSPPPALRGMLLAAACSESGYNPKAKGDYKIRGKRKIPRAIGLLQQWPWYERRYGTVRTDPESSSTTWMQHIVRQIPKVKKRCKFSTSKRIWVAAWVHGIRSKKPNGRCYEKPNHLKRLKRWHRKIRKNRDAYLESLEEPDGC